MRPTTHTLVVRVETPLPSGGCHTARLDSWTGTDTSEVGRPLWLVFLSEAPGGPMRFTQTLGWLHMVISDIEARPNWRQGDVWWRFMRFLNNVKVASRPNQSYCYKGWVATLQEAYHQVPSPPAQASCPRPCPCPCPCCPPQSQPVQADMTSVANSMLSLKLADDADGADGAPGQGVTDSI